MPFTPDQKKRWRRTVYLPATIEVIYAKRKAEAEEAGNDNFPDSFSAWLRWLAEQDAAKANPTVLKPGPGRPAKPSRKP